MAFFTFLTFAYYHQLREAYTSIRTTFVASTTAIPDAYNRPYDSEGYVPFTPRSQEKYDAPPGPPPSDSSRMSMNAGMSASAGSMMGGGMGGSMPANMASRMMGPPGPNGADGERMGAKADTIAMGGLGRRDSAMSTYSMRAAPPGPLMSDTTRMGFSDPFADFDRDSSRMR